MKLCVRCKKEKTIVGEKVCKTCLKELRKKFKIPREKDPLDFPEVQQLLQEYEEYH